MIDPDVQDWERLRKAMPAIETPKPSIDDQMKAYVLMAEEEFGKEMRESEWWKQHVARAEQLEYEARWGKEDADWLSIDYEPCKFSSEDVVNGIDEAMAKSHYWADSKKEDVVNSPSHYNNGSVECIEGIQASMSEEAFAGYLKGNCMKYLWRYDYKGKPVEDLQKAQWYLSKLLNVVVFEEGEE